jgi:hypothetical protein
MGGLEVNILLKNCDLKNKKINNSTINQFLLPRGFEPWSLRGMKVSTLTSSAMLNPYRKQICLLHILRVYLSLELCLARWNHGFCTFAHMN